MTKKISNLSSSDSFFQAQKAPKSVFGRGSAPDPAGGAYDAPPRPSQLGRGIPPPHSPSRSTPQSVLRPPSTQNPGYATEQKYFKLPTFRDRT